MRVTQKLKKSTERERVKCKNFGPALQVNHLGAKFTNWSSAVAVKQYFKGTEQDAKLSKLSKLLR